jgi:hypothetical protein
MSTLLFIYFLVLGMFWFVTGMFVLIDDEEGCYYVNAAVMGDQWKKADLNGWIKMVWLSILWPLYVTYLIIRYCSIPIIKFIWEALKFIFRVLIGNCPADPNGSVAAQRSSFRHGKSAVKLANSLSKL